MDLVLLDVGLPTMDGFEVLRSLRGQGSSIPVIMLTARTSTRDTVDGLDAGANDYVAKPFKFDELLARVRSRLREPVSPGSITIAHGDVSLDVLTRRAAIGAREIDLSAREFALAEEFLRHAGQVLSREQLLSRSGGWTSIPAPTWWTSTSAICAQNSVRGASSRCAAPVIAGNSRLKPKSPRSGGNRGNGDTVHGGLPMYPKRR